jgi:uncharacterized protein
VRLGLALQKNIKRGVAGTLEIKEGKKVTKIGPTNDYSSDFEEYIKFIEGGKSKIADEKSALLLIQKLSENSPRARFFLGRVYYIGSHGCKKNYKIARSYFEQSARDGFFPGWRMLGTMSFYGLGCKKDFYAAESYFKLAAKKNDEESLYYIGKIYKQEFRSGKTESLNKSIESFFKAAKYGFFESLDQIDELLLHLTAVQIKKYFLLLRKAHSSNDYFSTNRLGYHYFYGHYVKKNLVKALDLYKMAAKHGIVESMYNLGLCYYHGDACKRNKRWATYWFNKAYGCGHKKSLKYLKK